MAIKKVLARCGKMDEAMMRHVLIFACVVAFCALVFQLSLLAGKAGQYDREHWDEDHTIPYGSPFVADHYKRDYPQKYCRGCPLGI